MNNQEKDRIECAIRHIESSLDVDPWAVEIAVDAMKKQIPKELIAECDGYAEATKCSTCAAEHRQLAEWMKILKSAKFEYDEAWRTITHPTPDVTYADKQRAQVILDKFRNSLGSMK